MFDRIGLVAHRLHFLAAAIFRRIGHGMAAIAIGLHLKDDRPLAAAYPFKRGFGGTAGRQHVHAIDLDTGDAKAFAAAEKLILGRRAIDAGAHGVLVVLDHEDDRQLPQLGHVEGFIDLALVGRAVAEIGDAHAAIVVILVREAQARGYDNALMLDMNGNVAETAASNIFMVKDGVVFTPIPNGSFLSGITRYRAIELMRAAGTEVVEKTMSVQEFLEADEIFSTGNHSKVVPVTKFEDREFQAGPVARLTREAYMDWAHAA